MNSHDITNQSKSLMLIGLSVLRRDTIFSKRLDINEWKVDTLRVLHSLRDDLPKFDYGFITNGFFKYYSKNLISHGLVEDYNGYYSLTGIGTKFVYNNFAIHGLCLTEKGK